MIAGSEENPEMNRSGEAEDVLPLVVGSVLVAGVWMCLFLWLA
jgi:hypothetical protein